MQASQLKIIAATVVGLLLVGLAYMMPNQNVTTTDGSNNLIVVATAPNRTFIQTDDKDGNGIPDWQQSLTRTIPLAQAATTTTYQKPETLTEAFGQAFFEQYLTNKTYGSLGIDNQELVSRSTKALINNLQDSLIGPSALTTSNDTSAEAIKAYGNGFASIVYNYPSERDAETVILERALKNSDPDEIKELEPILNDYRGMIVDMQLLPVPLTYIKEHLDILNSMQAVALDIEAMLRVYEDPLLSLIRIKRYQDDVYSMAMAITNLYVKMVEQDKIQFTKDEPLGQLMGVTNI